jgi:hypothetical protein
MEITSGDALWMVYGKRKKKCHTCMFLDVVQQTEEREVKRLHLVCHLPLASVTGPDSLPSWFSSWTDGASASLHRRLSRRLDRMVV